MRDNRFGHRVGGERVDPQQQHPIGPLPPTLTCRGYSRFPLLKLNSDSGLEMINHNAAALYIEQTRTLPHQNAGQATVESKNDDTVRKRTFHWRYATVEELILSCATRSSRLDRPALLDGKFSQRRVTLGGDFTVMLMFTISRGG